MAYRVGDVLLGGVLTETLIEGTGHCPLPILTDQRVEGERNRVTYTNAAPHVDLLGAQAERLTFTGELPAHVEPRTHLYKLRDYMETKEIVEVFETFSTADPASYTMHRIGTYAVIGLERRRHIYVVGRPEVLEWTLTLLETARPTPS